MLQLSENGTLLLRLPKQRTALTDKTVAPRMEARRTGLVEAKQVRNLLLDTGCTRTLVRKELVPSKNMIDGKAVPICCAHGDTVLYPLATVTVAV